MTQEPKTIHVVGTLDLAARTGKLLYINPSTAQASAYPGNRNAGAVPPAASSPEDTGFELGVEDNQGHQLLRLKPAILMPSDDSDGNAALIDVTLPHVEGMARVVLLYDGKPVDIFEAGTPQTAGAAARDLERGLSMGASPPGHPDKRSMSMGEDHRLPEKGVSYTIQVRPTGERIWQTIAVGRSTPDFVIDRNQFPGAEGATVRVLRSTGFEDTVVAEEEVDLTFK